LVLDFLDQLDDDSDRLEQGNRLGTGQVRTKDVRIAGNGQRRASDDEKWKGPKCGENVPSRQSRLRASLKIVRRLGLA
jgi:hypothetical protein